MGKIWDINKVWAYIFSSIIGFFEPIADLFLWLLIFIVADLITGVYASLTEGQIIRSCKLQKTVQKFVMYALAVILLQGIDKYMITFADCGLANIGSTIICGIELYSIFENCYRITGNQVFKVLTTWTLKKIGDNTGVELDKEINKDKKGRKGNGN